MGMVQGLKLRFHIIGCLGIDKIRRSSNGLTPRFCSPYGCKESDTTEQQQPRFPLCSWRPGLLALLNRPGVVLAFLSVPCWPKDLFKQAYCILPLEPGALHPFDTTKPAAHSPWWFILFPSATPSCPYLVQLFLVGIVAHSELLGCN